MEQKDIIEALKEIELNIFKEFIIVCNKLNLRYYVIGGTLLGAVRHKGFIPWDDDIDIGMPREDYEIFLNQGQEFLPEYLFLQSYKSEKEWLRHFAKIRDSRTTFIESIIRDFKINHGCFIDIFPLDYTDSKKISIENELLSIKESLVFSGRNLIKKVLINLANVFTFCFSIKKAFLKREKLIKKYSDGLYLANYSGAWGVKEIVPKEWYGDGQLLDFEGIKVSAPIDYNKWLTQVYGNYMELPPIERRCTHHFTDIIDLEKSYKEYMKD